MLIKRLGGTKPLKFVGGILSAPHLMTGCDSNTNVKLYTTCVILTPILIFELT